MVSPRPMVTGNITVMDTNLTKRSHSLRNCSTSQQVHFVRRHLVQSLVQARRLIVTVAGFTILAAGIAMIVLPGPAVVMIPVGLAILATEYVWARKLLTAVKMRIEQMKKGNG